MNNLQTKQYDLEQAISKIIDSYGAKAPALIMALQDIQRHCSYLPVEGLKVVARKMNLPLAQIYSVATFYKAFSLEPKGEHHICVCTGTACHVRQASVIVDNLKLELGIEPRQTTPDGFISFETVNCLGACAMGPLVTVDDKFYGNVNVTKMSKIIKNLHGAENSHNLEDIDEAS